MLKVVHVDDVMDVVVLQHYGLAADQRSVAGEVDGVERGSVVRVDGLVPEIHGVPIESDVYRVTAAFDDLNVADVVTGAWFRNRGGRRPFGADPENSILQTALVRVVD